MVLIPKIGLHRTYFTRFPPTPITSGTTFPLAIAEKEMCQCTEGVGLIGSITWRGAKKEKSDGRLCQLSAKPAQCCLNNTTVLLSQNKEISADTLCICTYYMKKVIKGNRKMLSLFCFAPQK